MTQPPNPSAAALEFAQEWTRCAKDCPYMAEDCLCLIEAKMLDTFAAQAVAVAQTEWAKYDDAIREQGTAAERAKPAASDDAIAYELLHDFNDGWVNSAMLDALAAALAERGREERERCARIAESCYAEWDETSYGAKDAANAIRNYTINDEA